MPKTLDKTNLTHYRPISLLSVLSKLLEKHVHVQLNDYLEKKHLLIHPFQSGYRCKHSCNTALVRLTHYWLTAMNRSEMSGVIFLDLKKAFDLVDHDIMMYKLGCYLQNSSCLPVFQIVSWRQNATCFPPWLIFFWRLCKVWGTTRICPRAYSA